jgi:hypothetical protein
MMSQTSGIGWSLGESRMYYIDSLTRGIGVVDQDGASGGNGNRRRLFAAVGGDGVVPDGVAGISRLEGDDEDHCDLPGSARGEGDRTGQVTGPAWRASRRIYRPDRSDNNNERPEAALRTTRSGLAERTSVF